MVKIKLISLSLAISTAISASVMHHCFSCTAFTQYYYDGSTYNLAGSYGYDYLCFDDPGVCTYYKPNPILQPNYYRPCRDGIFTLPWLNNKK